MHLAAAIGVVDRWLSSLVASGVPYGGTVPGGQTSQRGGAKVRSGWLIVAHGRSVAAARAQHQMARVRRGIRVSAGPARTRAPNCGSSATVALLRVDAAARLSTSRAHRHEPRRAQRRQQLRRRLLRARAMAVTVFGLYLGLAGIGWAPHPKGPWSDSQPSARADAPALVVRREGESPTSISRARGSEPRTIVRKGCEFRPDPMPGSRNGLGAAWQP